MSSAPRSRLSPPPLSNNSQAPILSIPCGQQPKETTPILESHRWWRCDGCAKFHTWSSQRQLWDFAKKKIFREFKIRWWELFDESSITRCVRSIAMSDERHLDVSALWAAGIFCRLSHCWRLRLGRSCLCLTVVFACWLSISEYTLWMLLDRTLYTFCQRCSILMHVTLYLRSLTKIP